MKKQRVGDEGRRKRERILAIKKTLKFIQMLIFLMSRTGAITFFLKGEEGMVILVMIVSEVLFVYLYMCVSCFSKFWVDWDSFENAKNELIVL